MARSSAGPSYVRAPGAPFLCSLPVDRALARFDLAGSIVHVEMLEHVGLLAADEAQTLRAGLRAVGREIDAGEFPWREELEDVHTNVESRLTELVGPLGEKLHTGRSRNDQVALDERLFLRVLVRDVAQLALELASALVRRARDDAGSPMPGYTHLQRAQPVTLGHWLLAHYWRFDRDIDRLLATERRASVSPLGAGALAGSTLRLDPQYVAERLGFTRPFENSIDAVSDRDYFAEVLFDLALLAVHASGLAEEIVLFATKEFGFLVRTPALGSGSSLMPQKRNPDVPELVRGKAGRVVGDLVTLLTTLKGLPLAYDRDLQEDKAPVLDARSTVTQALGALVDLLPRLEFDYDRLRSAASDPELYATDLAEEMVTRGVPFRAAHESVGAPYHAVPRSEGRVRSDARDGAEPPADPVAAIARRTVPGGPGTAALAGQLRLADERLAARRQSLSSLDRAIERIEELLKEEPK